MAISWMMSSTSSSAFSTSMILIATDSPVRRSTLIQAESVSGKLSSGMHEDLRVVHSPFVDSAETSTTFGKAQLANMSRGPQSSNSYPILTNACLLCVNSFGINGSRHADVCSVKVKTKAYGTCAWSRGIQVQLVRTDRYLAS